jgi:hypothetical protein
MENKKDMENKKIGIKNNLNDLKIFAGTTFNEEEIDSLTQPIGEAGKGIADAFKGLMKGLGKDSKIGRTLNDLTDNSTEVGSKLNALFTCLEKGGAMGPAIMDLMSSSNSAGNIVDEFQELLEKAEDKVKFYTSEEAMKLFHNYSGKFKLTAYNEYDREILDKLLDIGHPYIFDFNSPMKQKYLNRFVFGVITQRLKNEISMRDILCDYTSLMLISENRFTEILYYTNHYNEIVKV